jgi:small subunit ribosomal protein S2
MVVDVTVKELLEAGVHFGHQTRRWNPKMRPYIYTQRDGIHIIDLDQTQAQAKRALKFVADTVALGSPVLFVGTKKQAKEVVVTEAQRAGQFFVSNRWLGGMLTNFKTISNSIKRLLDLEERREKGDFEKLTKKEALKLDREIEKLEHSLGGIKKMPKLPGAVFIVDTGMEKIARAEANKLGIPVVALVDTNCDPDGIDYLIAGNDDAIRSVQLFTRLMAEACLEGNQRREIALRESEARQAKDRQERDGKAKMPVRERERKIGAKGKAWIGGRRGEEAPAADAADVEQFASAKAEEPKQAETETETKTDKE